MGRHYKKRITIQDEKEQIEKIRGLFKLDKQDRKQRKCLRCNKNFMSPSADVRLCDQCKSSRIFQYVEFI